MICGPLGRGGLRPFSVLSSVLSKHFTFTLLSSPSCALKPPAPRDSRYLEDAP
jgi:hypothetical protein